MKVKRKLSLKKKTMYFLTPPLWFIGFHTNEFNTDCQLLYNSTLSLGFTLVSCEMVPSFPYYNFLFWTPHLATVHLRLGAKLNAWSHTVFSCLSYLWNLFLINPTIKHLAFFGIGFPLYLTLIIQSRREIPCEICKNTSIRSKDK